MEIIDGQKITGLVKNIIYEGKQVKDKSIDLTVNQVYKLTAKGQLDFGGGEYRKADKEKIKPQKENPEDDYGWWKLEPGTYLVSLNETVNPLKGLGLLNPHPRIMETGIYHPTLTLMEWKEDYLLPLTVTEKGINIKENARISKLVILK